MQSVNLKLVANKNPSNWTGDFEKREKKGEGGGKKREGRRREGRRREKEEEGKKEREGRKHKKMMC